MEKKFNLNAFKFAIGGFLCILLKHLMLMPNLSKYTFVNNNKAIYFIANFQDLGFIPRALFGSFIRIFTDFVSIKSMKIFYLVLYLILFIVYFIIQYKLMKKNPNSIFPKCLLGFVVIFPFSLLYSNIGWGSFDLVFFLVTFLCGHIVIYSDIKTSTILVSLLSILLIVQHTLTLFAVIPYIFLMFAYRLVNENITNKKMYTILISYMAIVSIAFIICQFFPGFKITNATDMNNYLNSRTDYEFDKITTDVMYYYPLIKHMKFDWFTIERVNAWWLIIITHIYKIPIFIFFIKLWVMMYKNSIDNKNKLFYIFCIISLFTFIPCIILASDHKRFVDFSIIGQLMILTSIYLSNFDNNIKQIEEYFVNVYNKYKTFIIFYSAISITLINVNEWYNGTLGTIFTNIANIFNMIMN